LSVGEVAEEEVATEADIRAVEAVEAVDMAREHP
jgi:hypothetical protein